MKSYKIAVIFPSRGLSFSETCEELLQNLEGYDYEIFFAHGLPLPDCFNNPLEQALKKNFTHYWFVEDDMVLPPYTLTKMLEREAHAVACDYPVTREGTGAIQYDKKGRVLFTGTGCLLIESAFLKKFKRPVFRTDVRWDIHVTREGGLELKKRISKGETYGMHDVTFGLECYKMGKPIVALRNTPDPTDSVAYYKKLGPTVIGQRKLKALGQAGTNQGQHDIEVWKKVTKQPDFINLVYEDSTTPLIAVKLKDGTITNVSEETATRLENASKGKRVEYGEVNFL